jgi:hypothetical protein
MDDKRKRAKNNQEQNLLIRRVRAEAKSSPQGRFIATIIPFRLFADTFIVTQIGVLSPVPFGQ